MADEKLMELAERVEAATGPDPDLDWAIINTINPDARWAYTASLDAAMTLVPEGKRRIEFGTYKGGRAWAYVHTSADVIGETDDAPTEAAAVCAAALRARAAQEAGNG